MHTTFPDAVCWSDGMPLLPQHFQMQALHAAGHAALLASAARPFYWGVLAIAHEAAGLAQGKVRISALDAILADGLAIRHTRSDPVLEIDVLGAFRSPDEIVTIYLAVPPLYRGGKIDAGAARFAQREADDVPDLSSKGEPASITTWYPRLHLMTDLGRHEVDRLPLMRVKQQGGGVVLADYMPPGPFVLAGSLLGQRVMRMLRRAREKCVFLAGRLQAAQRAEEHDDIAQIERQLAAIWSRLPEVEAMAASDIAHPLELYRTIAGMSGALAALRPARGVPAFAPFDYRDLLATFDPLLEWIDEALSTIRQGYRVRAFSEQGGSFWVDPPFDGAGATVREVVIGLRMPRDATEHDANLWLDQAVVASRPYVHTLARQRMRGLARRRLAREERVAYATGDDTVLYAVSLEDDWFDRTQPLCIELRAVVGRAPWAVQLFMRVEEAADGAQTGAAEIADASAERGAGTGAEIG
ncbi:type VI secretion system baseplate subunit TssK [Paraburkholderia bannensis]|uniref:type VI secretion system baseplate subunit TssK n=1 Tax=Paraburkholderia bannensis TaxID=765414 RepID=UPI002AB743FF|nr:type VI secretion system baseplate subunit TssK [Paraburkholderia bannensis]